MVQRIQSLFILLALLFCGLLFSLPLATILSDANQLYNFDIKGVTPAVSIPARFTSNIWPLPFLVVLINLLLVLMFFLYRKRMLQIRLGIYAAVLLIGLQGMIFFFILQINHIMEVVHRTFHIAIVFPIVSCILVILAIRAIRRDELLVNAWKRLH